MNQTNPKPSQRLFDVQPEQKFCFTNDEQKHIYKLLKKYKQRAKVKAMQVGKVHPNYFTRNHQVTILNF